MRRDNWRCSNKLKVTSRDGCRKSVACRLTDDEFDGFRIGCGRSCCTGQDCLVSDSEVMDIGVGCVLDPGLPDVECDPLVRLITALLLRLADVGIGVRGAEYVGL